MNERIKELLKQSGAYDHYQIMEGLRSDEKPIEKFAQLIILECAEVAGKTRWAVPPTQEQIASSIRQHFGVAE